jgi:hypothetical protein
LPSVWSEKTTPQPKVSYGLVPLDDDDLVRGILPLHQQREVEAGGAAADADDLHIRPE